MSSKTGQILGKDIAGVNCILPHKHKTAWDLFLKGCANNWMPTEISMAEDIKQWKNGEITDDEKLLVKRSLGFFAGSESLVGNNLLLSGFRFITDAECRQYILRQAFEESLHNLTVVYVCDSLDLKVDEVFQAYINIPSIKAKDDFLMEITTDISRNDFNPHSQEGKKEILRNFISYWIVCEGTFFFSGFAMLLALGAIGVRQFFLLRKCLDAPLQSQGPIVLQPVSSEAGVGPKDRRRIKPSLGSTKLLPFLK